jgi:rfaE bifunctional protein kinase chain/domain/rfaE bifunctional protein nucleotidyltransferase chain/domain
MIKKNNLFNKHQEKIVTKETLINFRKKNKDKKIIICHGVFDIVHPGHVRHLLYAKQKADILIVSVTSDIHINKGIYRPHVPESLRALNLSAFEVVDFVVIDKNPEPYDLIKKIKPNFFAKGFEYIESKNKKTEKEIEILNSYGGEIIFTPGDYINSSSKLINNSEPDLRYEKLLSILDKYNLTLESIEGAVKNIKKLKIDVLGDTIVDSYTYCKMIGGQTKTPTISLLYEKKIDYVGGAGIVAKHIAASGNKANFLTVLGDDDLKKFVLKDLKKSKVNFNGYIDKIRPTVNKNAFVSEEYRLLKVSKLDNSQINFKIVKTLSKKLAISKSNGVIFSDFRHGIFNKSTIEFFKKSIEKKKRFLAADSQVASWWGNILEFKNFDLITPNEKEARFALMDQISGIRSLASRIYDKSKCKLLIMKLGKRGLLACINNKHQNSDSYFTLDSFATQVIDPVGAGDALLAYSTMSMIVTNCKISSTIIGILAASCECEKNGNIPISKDDILNKIADIKKNI